MQANSELGRVHSRCKCYSVIALTASVIIILHPVLETELALLLDDKSMKKIKKWRRKQESGWSGNGAA